MAKSRKKSGINKSAVVCAVIIALAAVLITVIGAGSSWFTNADVTSWFNNWGTKIEVAPPELPEIEEGSFNLDNRGTAGTAAVEAGESTGISFQSMKLSRSAYASAGVPDEADTAFTLTATIQPDYATNKSVDWLIDFVDSASSWARGKTVTDYMTVTPAEDGALTATAVCTQAFAEQIKITVVSRDNAQIKAHCIVNYEEKITDVHLTLCGGEVDTSTLVGTWRLGNPSSSGFQYACSTLGGNWQISLEYATSTDYITYGYRYKSIMSMTSNGTLSGLWFAYSSSPSWSITFSTMQDTYKDFYLYIKSANETQTKYADILHAFQLGLFEKVSDDCGLGENTATLYGGSSYNFMCDITYSECTTPRKVSLNASVCAFGLVDNFNDLIGLSSDNSRPATYFPAGNLILSPSFTFDISMLAKMLAMPDDCFNAETDEAGNRIVNETGKAVLGEVINKIKETGAGVKLAYLKVVFVDAGGAAYYSQTFYFALNVGTLSIPVEDIIISDTEITI